MITAGTKHSTLLVTILIFVLTSALATFGADRQETTAAGSPKVVSVTQISHDGVSKANLLSDDTSLYVTESPATGHVVARLSLPSADRTVIPTAFQSVQALDISPDRTRLLVSPTRGGTGDSEFWTVPVRAGSPKRLGRLMGRDASWSADGLRVVFTKGSTLYIAKSDGTGDRALFTAPGSVFAPRFSPDGGRIVTGSHAGVVQVREVATGVRCAWPAMRRAAARMSSSVTA